MLFPSPKGINIREGYLYIGVKTLYTAIKHHTVSIRLVKDLYEA